MAKRNITGKAMGAIEKFAAPAKPLTMARAKKTQVSLSMVQVRPSLSAPGSG